MAGRFGALRALLHVRRGTPGVDPPTPVPARFVIVIDCAIWKELVLGETRPEAAIGGRDQLLRLSRRGVSGLSGDPGRARGLSNRVVGAPP